MKENFFIADLPPPMIEMLDEEGKETGKFS